MQKIIYELTLDDFARSFGTNIEDIPNDCRKLITKTDFKYKLLVGKERDKVILDVIKKIESDQQIIGAEERQGVWAKGWAENLEDFIIKKLEAQNRIEIVKIKRLFFGSLYHERYPYIIWKPKTGERNGN